MHFIKMTLGSRPCIPHLHWGTEMGKLAWGLFWFTNPTYSPYFPVPLFSKLALYSNCESKTKASRRGSSVYTEYSKVCLAYWHLYTMALSSSVFNFAQRTLSALKKHYKYRLGAISYLFSFRDYWTVENNNNTAFHVDGSKEISPELNIC